MVKDSGNRREFDTGAVRDIQEGKGRCDLLPLIEIAPFFGGEVTVILESLEHFKHDQDASCVGYLRTALISFAKIEFGGSIADMILEVAKHYEEGAKKYAERNWEKGIPTHCYIDSATRHLLKFLRGDDDERHDRAFVWNILGCMWTCKNRPDLNDYPIKMEDKNENRTD